jgi:hypothetical protein
MIHLFSGQVFVSSAASALIDPDSIIVPIRLCPLAGRSKLKYSWA